MNNRILFSAAHTRRHIAFVIVTRQHKVFVNNKNNMDRRRKLLLLKKKVILLALKEEEDAPTKKRVWVHPINAQREEKGIYHTLVQELRLDDGRHKQYFRMGKASFDHILSLIGPSITKQDTQFRDSIAPGMKLAVTLHHLAEGASHKSIASHYRLGRSTVSNIIYDTCAALYQVLQPIYMATPNSPDEWKKISER